MYFSTTTVLAGLLALAVANPMPEAAVSENPAAKLLKRGPRCTDFRQACQTQDAQWCVDYLKGLGTQKCTVNKYGYTKMCAKNGCYIHGRAVGGPESATSDCYDVGLGSQYIIDSCKRTNGYVEGDNAARGNGNLAVLIGNNNNF